MDLTNSEGETALMKASHHGHIEVVEKLLGKGASVDMANGRGMTALMEASRHGHIGVVEKLLEQGASVDIKDADGKTSLRWAVEKGHHKVSGRLVDIRDEDVRTALMRASYRGHLEIVLALLAANADVNAHDNDRMTALMFAVDDGHANVARHLLAVDGIEVPTGVRTRIVELLRKADDQLLKKAGVAEATIAKLVDPYNKIVFAKMAGASGDIPSPRRKFQLEVVGGTAYIYGGENKDGEVVKASEACCETPRGKQPAVIRARRSMRAQRRQDLQEVRLSSPPRSRPRRSPPKNSCSQGPRK